MTSPEPSSRRREKLSDSIAQLVMRDIRTRGLTSGSQLPKEADMIAQYGVGRGTLREAMRVLETCGLLSLKPGPGGGPVVQSVRADNFGRMSALFFQFGEVTYREVFEARLILEPVAARLAAERQKGSEGARALQELVCRDEGADGEAAYLDLTAAFHTSVIELGDNGVVTLLCRSLFEIYRNRVDTVLFPRSRRGQVHSAHAAIADAIYAGDADSAEHLMREHMEQYTRYLTRGHPGLLDDVVRWR